MGQQNLLMRLHDHHQKLLLDHHQKTLHHHQRRHLHLHQPPLLHKLPHPQQVVCWRFSSVIRHSAMRRFFKELMIVYQIVWFLRTTSSEDLSREDSYRKMLNEVKQKIKDWGCFVSLVHFNSRELLYLFLLEFKTEIIIAVIMIFLTC